MLVHIYIILEIFPWSLAKRDNPWDSFSELFFVSIDTHNDKENHHGFGITSAGAIVDGLWSGDWFWRKGLRYSFEGSSNHKRWMVSRK